jgi:hypothetical protein
LDPFICNKNRTFDALGREAESDMQQRDETQPKAPAGARSKQAFDLQKATTD